MRWIPLLFACACFAVAILMIHSVGVYEFVAPAPPHVTYTPLYTAGPRYPWEWGQWEAREVTPEINFLLQPTPRLTPTPR